MKPPEKLVGFPGKKIEPPIIWKERDDQTELIYYLLFHSFKDENVTSDSLDTIDT